uniref:Uncharacterized protein n=1 Tax=Oncorhynchus mykiss TaxID=8022 RepID=A0A8C7LUB5_ONCMY
MSSLLSECLYEISQQAAPPCKDYHQLIVTQTQIQYRQLQTQYRHPRVHTDTYRYSPDTYRYSPDTYRYRHLQEQCRHLQLCCSEGFWAQGTAGVRYRHYEVTMEGVSPTLQCRLVVFHRRQVLSRLSQQQQHSNRKNSVWH